jgi:DNA recombination protein RmuC
MSSELVAFIIGALFGAVIVFVIGRIGRKETRDLAEELVGAAEREKSQDHEILLGRFKDAMGALSMEALKANTGELVKLAKENLDGRAQLSDKELESKKQLIDQTLASMKADILKMQELVTRFESERARQFGELDVQLKSAARETSRLQETADHLRQALVSTKARGQWGERMAEDVLRLAGFVEGVNYLKQKTLEGAASRPDYTFTLPHGRRVNMDVKFPLNGYLRYLESESDTDRESHRAQFLRDVRTRIKEVTGRDYINPEDETLDYVLVFIPNEQVYAFINQNDPALIDDALKSKVILCSPFTLFAILAVIRQALDNFSMEQTAGEMLRYLGRFYKEWDKFRESMDKAGRKLDEAREEFQRMITTRRNKLEKPLQEIEDMRRQKGIEAEIALGEAEALEAENGKGGAEEAGQASPAGAAGEGTAWKTGRS